MKARKAYIAGLGTTGVLIASFVLVLTVVSTIVAFRGVPGYAAGERLGRLELGEGRQAVDLGTTARLAAHKVHAVSRRHEAATATRDSAGGVRGRRVAGAVGTGAADGDQVAGDSAPTSDAPRGGAAPPPSADSSSGPPKAPSGGGDGGGSDTGVTGGGGSTGGGSTGGGGGGGGSDAPAPAPAPVVGGVTSGLGDTVEQTTGALGNTVGGVSPQLGQTVTQTGQALGGVLDQTGTTVDGVVGGVTGGLDNTVRGVTGGLGSAVGGLTGGLGLGRGSGR